MTVQHPAGDTDFTDDSGHVEWNIDTQASSGMAPDADSLTLYFGTDLSDADVAKVFSQFTDDANGPKQASASYGECETDPDVSPLVGKVFANPTVASLPVGVGLGNNSDATLDQITRQAAAEGKTVFVSTGDTGSSCPIVYAAVVGAGNGVVNQVVPVTNSPASLPYVTAVGGTVLYTDGAGQAHARVRLGLQRRRLDAVHPEPDYQVGTPGNVNLHCVTRPERVCRGIADVAAQSGDVAGNGYDLFNDGTLLEGARRRDVAVGAADAGHVGTGAVGSADRGGQRIRELRALPRRQDRGLLRPGLLRRAVERSADRRSGRATARTSPGRAGTTSPAGARRGCRA